MSLPFELNPIEINQYGPKGQNLHKYIGYVHNYVFGNAGVEHYRLLAFLSHKFNNASLLDIGTARGFSAIALSDNKSNKVTSFEILDIMDKRIRTDYPEIDFIIDDIFTDDNLIKYKDLLLKSPLIFVDIHPHDGILEWKLYQFLRDNNYQGIILFDDIIHFPEMQTNFWKLIPDEYKLDITYAGHWSGTGLVRFIK